MRGVRLLRIWSFGWQGMRRNIWLSVNAIVTVALTVMSISVFVALNGALNETRKSFEEKLDITVFIKETAAEQDVVNFVNQISERKDTTEVLYLDKEKSKAEFMRLNEDDPELLASLEDVGNNPLPRYVQIKTDNPDILSDIDTFARQDQFLPVVDSTSYKQTKDKITQFVNFTKFTLKNSLVISAFFATISIIVVFNVIRLAIFSRRQEIQVMRYVGASHQFIRWPFVVEGTFLGASASVISLILLYLLALWESSLVPIYFPGSGINPAALYGQYFWVLFWSNVGSGILLTAIISYIAVRRYLKEQ